MNKKTFILILLVAYLASCLRLYINNILVVNFLGSFLYGLVVPRKLSKSKKEILITGFCSCFTSFSGFVSFSYQIIIQGNYIKLFIYLNLIVILNLIIMYIGFLLSRKMT